MAKKNNNGQTPRTCTDNSEKHLSTAWQEEQYSARHEYHYGCDDVGYDCPEFDD